MAKAKAGPVVSDNGNFIIDAPFSPDVMKDPYKVQELAYSVFRLTPSSVDYGKNKNAYRRCGSWPVLPYGTGSLLRKSSRHSLLFRERHS